VDANAQDANAPEDLVIQKFFGRLERVFSFSLPPTLRLPRDMSPHVVFLAIRTCEDLPSPAVSVDITYYRNLTSLDILDLTTAQCVIGRVEVAGRWAIIDRTGSLQRSWYNEDDGAEG
jgi:hypothetical protein